MTKINTPLFIYFPRAVNINGELVFAKLGTIDFIFPAMYISRVLQMTRGEDGKSINRGRYYRSLIGYVAGLLATTAVSLATNRQTPALPLPSIFTLIFSSI